MIKKISAVALIAALLAGGHWYLSGNFAVNGLSDAVANNDIKAFNEYIDYVKLKHNVKGKFSDKMHLDNSKDEPKNNPFAKIENAIGNFVVDQVAESFVTPEKLIVTMRHGNSYDNILNFTAKKGTSKEPKWITERVNLNQIIITPIQETKDFKKQNTKFVLEREGYASWKVTHIIL